MLPLIMPLLLLWSQPQPYLTGRNTVAPLPFSLLLNFDPYNSLTAYAEGRLTSLRVNLIIFPLLKSTWLLPSLNV